MPVSDVLKGFRSSGYEKKEDAPQEKEKESSGVRTLKLTDDEAKEIAGYQQGPGQELTCEITGKLEDDGHFHVMSVHLPGGSQGDMNEMAKSVAGSSLGGTPMMNMQTQPSPS